MLPGGKHAKYERKRPANLPEWLVKAVGRSYAEGMSINGMATYYGVSRPTIYRWIRGYGWKRSNAQD